MTRSGTPSYDLARCRATLFILFFVYCYANVQLLVFTCFAEIWKRGLMMAVVNNCYTEMCCSFFFLSHVHVLGCFLHQKILFIYKFY